MIQLNLKEVKTMFGLPTDSTGFKAYRSDDGLAILLSNDNIPKWGRLIHVSISRQDRFPSWEEILAVKEHFFGDIDVMMVLPKKEDYVNVHKNCFHLWQTPERWGIQ